MARSKRNKRAEKGEPLEIPMTDLGWSEEGDDQEPAADTHAAGTPGGGTAIGGLAGSNIGHGDPDEADLENAMGSGIHDSTGEEEGHPPYSGLSGGAVGGTPAERRAKGGHIRGGIAPGSSHRGDSSIGSDPGAGS